jgi:polyisoprenyl-phosphate glycosyltransferase
MGASIMTEPIAGKLSIVVPLYNEAGNVDALFARLLKLEDSLPVELEFVFVDDGSADRSFEIASKLCLKHPRVRLLKFASNSGSHAAIMAGLQESTGDCAAFLAGDLQDPPELLSEMLAKWKAGARIVWGARTAVEGKSKKDSLFSSWYWELSRFLTETNIPRTGVDFFLIDRKVIEAVVPHAHVDTPSFQLIASTGFKSDIIYYRKQPRCRGKSGWTLKKKLMLSLETLLFSFKAVRILAVAGLVLFAAGLLAGILAFSATWVAGINATTAGIIGFVAAFSGLQMAMLGLVGEYINLALKEARKTQRFIVEQKLCSSAASGDKSETPDPALLSFKPESISIPPVNQTSAKPRA